MDPERFGFCQTKSLCYWKLMYERVQAMFLLYCMAVVQDVRYQCVVSLWPPYWFISFLKIDFSDVSYFIPLCQWLSFPLLNVHMDERIQGLKLGKGYEEKINAKWCWIVYDIVICLQFSTMTRSSRFGWLDLIQGWPSLVQESHIPAEFTVATSQFNNTWTR